jgi:hypothetical protein
MSSFEFMLSEFGKYVGYPMVALISIIGIRYLFYYDSFFFRGSRYRQLKRFTNDDIRALPHLPFVKIQTTTRGLLDSTEVVRRGIRQVAALCKEAPDLYSGKLSVEVVTESSEQKDLLEREFGRSPGGLKVFVLVVPDEYETPKGTKLKARALHYMVEQRRRGFNRKPEQTFIVHYDEESVLEPDELRKLIHYLAITDKKLAEGPIFYPLEHDEASIICQAVEAHRPINCFECQKVMESGIPLHLHGSNLVVDEELENELGWDMGTLDGQPFLAEDHVFGVTAYVKKGPQVFGWHGCSMLEQPPFSFKAAFKQRYRWITGVLQGLAMLRRMPEFQSLPRKRRFRLVWGVLYRVLTFALGLPTGIFGLLFLLYQAVLVLSGQDFTPLPLPLMAWMFLVGFFWLNATFVGAWYNLFHARHMSPIQRWVGGARVLTVAPIAGILESSAALWALVKWVTGYRLASWDPTPKSK